MIFIETYNDGLKKEWDALVDNAANATFLHKRDFMEYHKDRFADASAVFVKNNSIVALLPANWDANTQTVCSHGGLTYGGILRPASTDICDMQAMFKLALDYYRERFDASAFHYKPTPYIYHASPCDEDLYCITRLGGTLDSRCISSATCLPPHLPLSSLRKRKCKLATKHGLVAMDTRSHERQLELLPEFWGILKSVLAERHGVKPVHSIEEIESLANKFPDNIRLVAVCNAEGEMVGGSLLFVSPNVVHAQYIAANQEGRENGALDLLFSNIIKEYSQTTTAQRYFDFGISTEKAGTLLNEGLIFQKEGFGARGICYDSYTIKL